MLSMGLHAVVAAACIVTFPTLGVVGMPRVPQHIAAFVAPAPVPALPLPAPRTERQASTEAPASQAESPAPEDRPPTTTAGSTSNTSGSGSGLLAATPVSSAMRVGRGVAGGGSANGLLTSLRARRLRPATREPTVPIRVGGAILAPTLVTRVEPVYPTLAVRAGLEGTVVLETTVGRNGRPASLTVLRSGGPLLDRAAREAVSQWMYEPLLYHGDPVPFVLTVTIFFSLGPAVLLE